MHFHFTFQTNESMKSLRLTGNKIGNRGGMAFAHMLQVNTTLEALDVADCDLVCLHLEIDLTTCI